MLWQARHHRLEFPRRPLVMGIVNLNDDSFCGDGSLDPAQALAQAARMLRDGADVIDIGAESARTNRGPITEEEEVRRLRPFLDAWSELIASFSAPPWDDAQVWPPLLSINTWRPAVVAAVLPHGGDLINDIGALPDATNARLCAEHGVSLLIMHSIGEPKVPHTHVGYDSILDTLDRFFEEKIALCREAGLDESRLILDPGIDFAKQRDDNLVIYRHLERLHRFDRPILLPVSRKTVIGQVLDQPDATQRDPGTIACLTTGVLRGAQIFRVHHVRGAALAVKTLWGVTGGRTLGSGLGPVDRA
jgi:dihydropteroate synthase